MDVSNDKQRLDHWQDERDICRCGLWLFISHVLYHFRFAITLSAIALQTCLTLKLNDGYIYALKHTVA